MLSEVRIPAAPEMAVLVLHGGSADSARPVGRFSLAAARMIPVAGAIARGIPGAAVHRLRNPVRGWNGDGGAVLAGARWAIARIEAAHPGVPIVVVGHSLGGRMAAHLAADEPSVVGAVGLAPWLEPTDPVSGLGGVPIAVVQGTRDRTIPTRSTEAWLARAVDAGALVRRAVVEGGEHAMLRHHRRWDRLCVDGVSWVSESVRRCRQAP